MAHELADEVLDKILVRVVCVPDEDFLDVSGMHSSPFARRLYSSSTVLLVCKRWLRIATPRLYDTVVLRSTAQALALSTALTKVPEFAPFIKRLRLEGAFGAAVGNILRAVTHLRDLHISIDLNSKDNIKAMCEALPMINPSCLALSLPSSGLFPSKRATEVLRAIQDSAPYWTNLTTVVVPYHALSIPGSRRALFAFPNILELHLEGYIHALTRLKAVLERWPQCKAHIEYEMIYIVTYDKASIDAFLMNHAEQLVIHRKDDAVPVVLKADGNRDRPMSKALSNIQQRIWATIFQHALSVPEFNDIFPHYRAEFRSVTGRPLSHIITSRHAMNLMLVCQQFKDICLPIALRHVFLPRAAQAESFSSLVEARPELASGVDSVFLTSLPDINGHFPDVVGLTSRLINMRTLRCGIDISDTGILQTCGPGLLQLDISYSMAHVGVAASTMTPFSFPTLRRLRISPSIAFPRRERLAPLLSIDLPQLEELCFADYTPGWLIDYFAKTQWVLSLSACAFQRLGVVLVSFIFVDANARLPRLRFFTMQHGRDHSGELSSSGVLKSFLSAHGPAVQNIAAHAAHLGLVLELCPSVHTVILAFSQDMPWSLALVQRVEPHVSLTTLLLPDAILSWASKKVTKRVVEEGTAFFDAITRDKFPALKGIPLARVTWPALPRDIAGRPVVMWAESLKEKGITLLDESGTPWRSRLK